MMRRSGGPVARPPLLATPGAPFRLFPSLHLAFSFILLTVLHGAFLDHMFHPLSPAKQPYYINLLSFPVTCSLPVNSHFPMLGLPNHSSRLALLLPTRRYGCMVSKGPRTLLALAF